MAVGALGGSSAAAMDTAVNGCVVQDCYAIETLVPQFTNCELAEGKCNCINMSSGALTSMGCKHSMQNEKEVITVF